MFVTGLVLAAGSSQRLGRPKQLLPYRGSTLLDATLATARRCGFDELLVTVGGAGDEVRAQVDLRDCTVVDGIRHTAGCSSSIVAALDTLDRRSEALVLLLGDQPGVRPDDVRHVAAVDAPIAVCRYRDGIGHPFRFDRSTYPDLRSLHGDKAVWKLIESGRRPVMEVPATGDIPLDVDTWEDYEQLLEADGTDGDRPRPRTGSRVTAGGAPTDG
jgi:molybdenum cofactor cytidylyltransferase